MRWQQWVLVALFGVNALVTVANVGKPRKATTPLEASIVVGLAAALIYCVVSL